VTVHGAIDILTHGTTPIITDNTIRVGADPFLHLLNTPEPVITHQVNSGALTAFPEFTINIIPFSFHNALI
jgi:hypothetical protein